MADKKTQPEKTGEAQESPPTSTNETAKLQLTADNKEYVLTTIETIRDEIFTCEMFARALKQALNPQGKVPDNDPAYRDILAMQKIAGQIADVLHEQIAELWNIKHQITQVKPGDLH